MSTKKARLRISGKSRYIHILYHLLNSKYLTAVNTASLIYLDIKQGKFVPQKNQSKKLHQLINVRGIQKNLADLCKHGFAEKLQLLNTATYGSGTVQALYRITELGAEHVTFWFDEHLKEYKGNSFKYKPHKGNPANYLITFLHRKGLADISVQMQTFFALYSKAELLYFCNDKELRIRYKNGLGKYSLIDPDLSLFIYNKHKKVLFPVFIEFDRGTESMAVLLEKTHNYMSLLKNKDLSNLMKQKYNSIEPIKDVDYSNSNFAKFKVLFVFNKGKEKRRNNFIGAVAKKFGEMGGLFRATTLDHFISWERTNEKYSTGSVKSRLIIKPDSAEKINSNVWYSCNAQRLHENPVRML